MEREASRLDQAVVTLEEFINTLTEDNIELRPLVDEATEHALKLQEKANYLDSMIANTREYAEAAFRASNAYQAIVDAIKDANNYSMMAVADAKEAEDKVNLSHTYSIIHRVLVSCMRSYICDGIQIPSKANNTDLICNIHFYVAFLCKKTLNQVHLSLTFI